MTINNECPLWSAKSKPEHDSPWSAQLFRPCTHITMANGKWQTFSFARRDSIDQQCPGKGNRIIYCVGLVTSQMLSWGAGASTIKPLISLQTWILETHQPEQRAFPWGASHQCTHTEEASASAWGKAHFFFFFRDSEWSHLWVQIYFIIKFPSRADKCSFTFSGKLNSSAPTLEDKKVAMWTEMGRKRDE